VLCVKQLKYVKQFAGQEPILGRICGIEVAQFLSRHFGQRLPAGCMQGLVNQGPYSMRFGKLKKRLPINILSCYFLDSNSRLVRAARPGAAEHEVDFRDP
jgi:hypothetical protein